MAKRLRIHELAELVALAVDEGAFDQSSARVRDVPDVRTIRYYTTIGLLDRPVEMRGRTALYGGRHFLQLLAIKRLQSQGKSLTEIQAELAGTTDATLRRITQFTPEQIQEIQSRQRQNPEQSPSSQSAESAPGRGAAAFWKQTPQMAAPTAPSTGNGIQQVALIRLLPGVSLLLDGVDASRLDEQMMSRLQPAIDELSRTLQSLELKPSNGQPSNTENDT